MESSTKIDENNSLGINIKNLNVDGGLTQGMVGDHTYSNYSTNRETGGGHAQNYITGPQRATELCTYFIIIGTLISDERYSTTNTYSI